MEREAENVATAHRARVQDRQGAGGGLGNIKECAELLGLEGSGQLSPLSTDVAASSDDIKDGSSRAGGRSESKWWCYKGR